MQRFLRRLIDDQRAATAIEYTFIVAMIAIAAIGGMTAAGHAVLNMLGPAANALQ
jgi:Flp pilus assembly pilin Flp